MFNQKPSQMNAAQQALLYTQRAPWAACAGLSSHHLDRGCYDKPKGRGEGGGRGAERQRKRGWGQMAKC